ncbi:FAD-dependent oxidoreductase [Pseudoroseicyclus sp. CXY001]|uniref:FAD-dependent oxidoreductase n=1 Tax=Pseudoroseicyclus sp. CXY001 TaxID=3242492 RepID=UPI00358DB275
MKDEKSVASARLTLAERAELLVIGAGPAGLSAAITAAEAGMQVVLVDENPVPFEVMGDDVPLHFGQGASGVARNSAAMLEAIIESEPLIERAFEAGVDLRLGVAAWGLYANGPEMRWLPGAVAGLTDGAQGWMLGADHVIVASGRRDMGLAFPGWERPGVMGATAAVTLARRYQALAPRRVVLIGTGAEALLAARELMACGVEIAAIVEQASAPVGPPALAAEVASLLSSTGGEMLCGHVPRGVAGGEAVTGLTAAPVAGGAVREIACDGVILGVGVTPVVDLLGAMGCDLAFQAERGGYAPLLGPSGRTSVASVHAVGDCAGIWPKKSADRAIAEAEGARAAAAILTETGRAAPSLPEPELPGPPALDLSAYRTAWMRAAVIDAPCGAHVCQCEEVTAREILELRPPRYLGWAPPEGTNDERSLARLLGEGPPNPDQVKRLTRAGMGPCQGRRCREQVAALLALQSGETLAQIPLAGYRAPVRPLPLAIAAQIPEVEEMRAHWEVWFGIPSQWRPWWEHPGHYTSAGRERGAQVNSE